MFLQGQSKQALPLQETPHPNPDPLPQRRPTLVHPTVQKHAQIDPVTHQRYNLRTTEHHLGRLLDPQPIDIECFTTRVRQLWRGCQG